MAEDWHYTIRRLNGDGTETTLATEVPITDPDVWEDLSGPGGFTGLIKPEIARLTDDDGVSLFQRWKTVVYAQTGEQIHGAALVVDMEDSDAEISIDCMGYTGYPNNQPYNQVASYTGIDAADLFRSIYNYLQGLPDGDLGIELDDTKSGVLLGKAASPEYLRAVDRVESAKNDLKVAKTDLSAARKIARNAEIDAFRAAGLTTTGGEVIEQQNAPSGSRASKKNLWLDENDDKLHRYNGRKWVEDNDGKAEAKVAIQRMAVLPALEDDVDRHEDQLRDAEDAVQKEEQAGGAPDPYLLNYWSTHDLGKVLDELAAETPFEYRMEHSWEGEEARHFLRIGGPRIGRRRHDLSFVLGVNVDVVPTITYAGEEYATGVIVLGAGEGRAMIRGEAHRATGGLRRVVTVVDKNIRTKRGAERRARTELRRRTGDPDIHEIVAKDHPNAPLGSYRVGDEIPYDMEDEDLHFWCRILSTSKRPETGEVVMSVLRTEMV